ncbi:MAG: hypothetical protein J2P50_11560, partial [Hyphomicrobiaceae bacterium]|nr:hypothetical protein [Hyphomicrobiaceae bacterium]
MQPPSVNRRDLLRLALGGMAIPGLTASARSLAQSLAPANAAGATGLPDIFTPAKVLDIARALAAEPYKPPS